MPSSGTPRSKTRCAMRGAPGAIADSGPPEKMIPFGANFAISSGAWSQARISQYTPISRTRRAISCVYCEPKSRMRILSVWMFCTRGSVIHPVVRRFLGDLHVVHVRLAHACARDAHELRTLAHRLDVLAAAVAHRCPQATDQLVHDAAQRPAIRHAAFDAFRHQLLGLGFFLEIAIGRTLRH